jgi:hypothetical protein
MAPCPNIQLENRQVGDHMLVYLVEEVEVLVVVLASKNRWIPKTQGGRAGKVVVEAAGVYVHGVEGREAKPCNSPDVRAPAADHMK